MRMTHAAELWRAGTDEARVLTASRGVRQRAIRDRARQELELTFDELALIYNSLRVVRTLALLPRQDELLEDTIQLVDVTMAAAAHDPK
jgi:hypothetical protein